MPKVIKILLIGDLQFLTDLIADFASCKDNDWSNPKINSDMAQATLQINGEAIVVQIHMLPDETSNQGRVDWLSDLMELLKNSQVALTVINLCEQDYQNVDGFVEETVQKLNPYIRRVLLLRGDYREATADPSYLLPLFYVKARAESVDSLRNRFDVHGRDFNITVTESNSSFFANYLKNRLISAIDKGRIKPKEEHAVFRKVSGSLVGAVLGTLAAIFVYNPLASLFAATSGLVKNKSFKDFALLLISPIWGPLYGLFYKGLYLQSLRGWEVGFKQSFNALFDVPKNAALKEKIPISVRNIVASLTIIVLSLAAVGSVLISPVSLLLGIPTLLIAFGLSGISLPWLALLAGGVALGATTALYALGVVLADHAFDCGLAGIKRNLSGREKGTYQQLMGDDQPLANVAAANTLTVTDTTPADAIGAKSVAPLVGATSKPAAATQKSAAASSQSKAVLSDAAELIALAHTADNQDANAQNSPPQPAAAPSQRSGGDAFEHAFVSTPLPASDSGQPKPVPHEAALPPGWGLGFERMLTGQPSPSLRLAGNNVK